MSAPGHPPQSRSATRPLPVIPAIETRAEFKERIAKEYGDHQAGRRDDPPRFATRQTRRPRNSRALERDCFRPRHGMADQGRPAQARRRPSLWQVAKLQGLRGDALSLCVSTKRLWAGKRVEQASVVYIAAEGAAGLRKRKTGYVKAWPDLPAEVDFRLIPAAPNLGAEEGDRRALIVAIEGAGVKPGLIVIDTVAKAVGAADENGQGMAALLGNAEALAQCFSCLVLCVHHVGHGEDAQGRPRGWSGLPAALDVMILSERPEGAMEATLTIQKLKDDASNISLTAHLSRIILGHDRDGDEVSTLVVVDVVEADVAKGTVPRSVSKSERLLMDAIANAIDETGEEIQPYPTDPLKVRAVAERHIRKRYFDRVAEKADKDEDKEKVYDRNRKNLKNAIKRMIDARTVVAVDREGERYIWLPRS